ncbi:MAG: DUF368 domain-containing protein [Fusobacteriaceae bacterium]|jgi:putative membrane protein|nr:DUF368 domain-containing protein [Fusobacteriaceae bacterium]
MKETAIDFLKGLVIGSINVIPGVSGGTMAVILGIFEKLTESISCFVSAPRAKKYEYLKFLAAVGIGMGIGIVAFTNIVLYFLTRWPRATAVVFILMVLPSIPLIVKGLDKKNGKNILFFVAGLILTGIFVFLDAKYGSKEGGIGTPVVVTTGYCVKMLVCGAIAAGAMIIPGISGSLILLILGEYHHIIGFVGDLAKIPTLLKGYRGFGAFVGELHLIPVLFFGVGVILGLLFVAKLLNFLLQRYKGPTLFFITGLVIVSLYQIWLKLS